MSNQIRTVKQLVKPQWVMEGAGVRLRRSIAGPALNYADPFLLFDHFGSDNPDDYLKGFPMHPHRGIETVTYMLAGAVNHKDTIGNAGSLGAGDVQWMTSGGGIMHEEMPQPVDGRMEGFQLWVNLPAALKMSEPRYQEIPADTIPFFETEEGVGIRVIAGRAGDVTGPVTEIAADPLYLDITVPAGKTYHHPVPADHTAFVYAFDGRGRFSSQDEFLENPFLAVLSDGNTIAAEAGDASLRLLLAAGKPLNEPIARYGPFVMNTQAEIRQALEDLQNGTFVWGAGK